jgi:hypothetical protein
VLLLAPVVSCPDSQYWEMNRLITSSTVGQPGRVTPTGAPMLLLLLLLLPLLMPPLLLVLLLPPLLLVVVAKVSNRGYPTPRITPASPNRAGTHQHVSNCQLPTCMWMGAT